jgi:hypothetical protein
MKAALLLIFSSSHRFTMKRRQFYNSQILDKKKTASGMVPTSFAE